MACISHLPAISTDTQTAPTPHPIAQEMFRAGAMTCAHTAHELATIITASEPISFIQIDAQNPDNNITNASIYTEKENSPAIFNMTFAPSQSRGCGASLRGLMYIEKNCRQIAKKFYPEQKINEIEKKGILFSRINEKSQATFLPAGKGCILMTEELVK